MRRTMLLLSIMLAVCGGATGVRGLAATAQDATPATAAPHPVVGTWLLDANADDPGDAPEVATFTADGGVIAVEADGTPTLGVWEATGERTARVTLYQPGVLQNGDFGGIITTRATVEVAADGETLTAEYTIGVIPPPGVADQGQFGPGHATATRLHPEAMGTPVGPLSAVTGGGTPPATPAG